MHDGTQLNKQGPDVGSQYRSVIFPTTEEQKQLVQSLLSKMPESIVTTIEEFGEFYDAETYHQHYLDKNPGGYCHIGLEVFSQLKLGNY